MAAARCPVVDAHLLEGADRDARIAAPARRRRDWLGGTLSIAMHAGAAMLALGVLSVPSAGLPPGGEVAVEVELISAKEFDSLSAEAGARLSTENLRPEEPLPTVTEPEAAEPRLDPPPDVLPHDFAAVQADPAPADAAQAADLGVPESPDIPMPVAAAELPATPHAAEVRPTAAEPVPAASPEPLPPMPAFQSTTTPGLPRPTKQEAETGRSPPPKAQARTTDGARPRRDGRRRGGQGVAGEGLDAANSTASIRAGSTGRADPAAGRAAFASFEARVLSHLARHKRYPDAARRQDLRGRVAVTFSLDAGGQVISVGLAGSSGHPILDQEALAMMRRASPFPSIPPESGRTTVGFTAPVLYETR